MQKILAKVHCRLAVEPYRSERLLRVKTGPTTSACGIPCRGYQALDLDHLIIELVTFVPSLAASRPLTSRSLHSAPAFLGG